MSPVEPLRARVAAEALSWVNTPYLHQAMVKGSGVDCCMILKAVYEACELVPLGIDPRPYPMQWHLHRGAERYLEWFQKYAHKVDVPGIGDIALYRYGRTVSHSGIIVDSDNIVHAFREAGMVIKSEMRAFTHRLDSYWSLF